MKKHLLAVVLTLWPINVPGVFAQINELDSEKMCELLEDLKLRNAYILSAEFIPAAQDLPELCWVDGYILPAIHFSIILPVKNWNNKFFMEGCGGACGQVNFSRDARIALERGYAVSTMDAGHWGESLEDYRWAYNNRLAEIDWAYRAVHETALLTQQVIEFFYGHLPLYSYFQGCSTGGRMGLMEAWRYPEDFDGIISEAPGIDIPGLILSMHWTARKNMGTDGQDIITPDDMELIAEAVFGACDSLDGVRDRLVEYPVECEFKPIQLLCAENQQEDCLTAEQVETLQAWYGGPKNSSGAQLYPGGVPLGSEVFWADSFTGETSLEFFRYLAFQQDPGEEYGMLDFDFDTDPPRLEFMAHIINPDDPDLFAFSEYGGKLLMYQGWADTGVTPWKTIQYYQEVEEAIGSREATQAFFRLFMIPGMDHCGLDERLGISARSLDPLSALERWVEQGEAPDSLMITRFDPDGNPLWKRPVYPYPQRSK